jgi:magnesium transporter
MAEVLDPETAPVPPELALRDAEGDLNPAFVETVAAAIAAGDAARLHDLAGDIHEAELGALIEALDADDRPRLVELMGREFDFAALNEVDDTVRDEILEELEPETVAEGVRELDADDAVALLEDLDAEDREEILEAMPDVERVALERSLDYPEESAGRLMQTSLISVPAHWTVGDAIDHMRDAEADDLPESFFEIFVVDPRGKLLGNVFLDKLMRARRPVPVAEIMDEDRRRVNVTDDREDVARLFERYNLVSAAVVDEHERLVGVVTIDDVVDVIQEEAGEDILALGGVKHDEELSDNVWWIARSRFLWLFVNLVTAFAASSVIGLFANEVQKMVALAILVPIVASQGGNAATQTMTVAVRALATRELTAMNALRVTTREATVGLLNGAAFGLLTGLAAGTWFADVGIGVVIALAMLTNLVAGALGGILIPLTLERMGYDPAVASSPFVTTVTDVVGNFAFLGIATLWFGLGGAAH